MTAKNRIIKLPQLVKTHLRVQFKNLKLLKSAFIHPSFRYEVPQNNLDDFDRLEFLGDSILNYLICQSLYKKFPDANEGLLSKMRSILVSRKMLSKISKELNIPKVAILGKGLENQSMLFKVKLYADIFESFLAAYFFDQGLGKTQKFVSKIFNPYLKIQRLFRFDPNPKSTLQELCQKKWQNIPEYQHQKVPSGIKVTVRIQKTHRATAVGRTHRDGEEKAARLLIRKIRYDLASSRRNKVSSGKKLRNPSREV